MNVEIWDLYDAQGEKTGKTMIRGEAIPVGFYHIGVHIWPMNDKGELLIQRRSIGVQWMISRFRRKKSALCAGVRPSG